MKNDIRYSGIDIIGDVPWGTHFCQFYQTKKDLTDIIIPFLKAGLESNEFCIWIISYPLEAEEAKETLRKDIPYIDIYLEKRQIEFISYTDWYVKDGVFDSQRALNGLIEKMNTALASGYNGLRLIENTRWLEKGNQNNFVDYEKKLDSIIDKSPIIVLCTYSLDTCNTIDIIGIVANHQFVLVKKEGKWEKMENPGRKNSDECRQTEKELQESEGRYRMLFTNMAEGFGLAEAIYDKNDKPYDYRFIEINPAFELNTGVKREWILGKTMLEVFPNTSPISRKTYRETILSGQPAHFGVFSKELNRYLEIYTFSPQKGKLALIFRDVTKQKKLEEQTHRRAEEIEAIMEVAPVAIWIGHDPQSKYITGNRMADELYETKAGENISANIGPVRRFYHNGRELNIDELPMQQAALKDINVYNAEVDVLLPSGKLRSFLGSASPLHDEEGHVRGSVGAFMDITERKQVEEALRKSEERYRILFTNMTDGFCLLEVIYDKHGKPYDYRYLELNPAFERSLGVRKEQTVGKTMLEIFPNVNPIAFEKYGEVALSGKPTHFEILSQITYKYLDIYAFSPENGKLALILRDSMERKQMEKELQESEEKYRNIVETATEGIWIGDSEARTIYVNKRIAEMIGYTPDEIIGRYAWDFTDSEGKPIIKKNIEKRRQGINERYEFKFTRKDGSPLWTIVSSKSLFNKNGEFTGSMSMLTDITKRKAAEDALKETLNNLEEIVKARTAELEKAYKSLEESQKGLAEAQKMAHIGNWEWDIAKDKAFWSEELYRIFRRNPQEPGANYEEFLNYYVHPDDRDYVDSAIKKAINGKPYSIDYRIVLANGEERIVHMQSQVVLNGKNIPTRIKGIIQDITERKRTEEALAKIEKIRIKEIHHRIKNNLQVISSLLDLQAETFSHSEVCKTPEVVEAFMESQNRVISMALIHEELYKGDRTDTLDFAAYLRKLASDLFGSYNIGNKDISFELNLEQVYLGMDTAIPLGIIVNELISNSFKHAFPSERGGKIQINLRRTEIPTFNSDISGSEKECIEKTSFQYILEVSDNGKGIPQEIDFSNVDSLGFQLVNILVEQIDGCIKLEREHGTKFVIWLNNIKR